MDHLQEPLPIRNRHYHPMLDPMRLGKMTMAQVEEEIKRNYNNDQMKILKPDTKRNPANLVSSLCQDGMHRPALDIDVPCELIPSSTEGHHHLYLATAMPWEDYRLLLEVMTRVGIVEKGYRDMSIRDKQSFLRLPGVNKIR